MRGIRRERLSWAVDFGLFGGMVSVGASLMALSFDMARFLVCSGAVGLLSGLGVGVLLRAAHAANRGTGALPAARIARVQDPSALAVRAAAHLLRTLGGRIAFGALWGAVVGAVASLPCGHEWELITLLGAASSAATGAALFPLYWGVYRPYRVRQDSVPLTLPFWFACAAAVIGPVAFFANLFLFYFIAG